MGRVRVGAVPVRMKRARVSSSTVSMHDEHDESQLLERPAGAHDPAPLQNDMFRAFEDILTERHPGAVVLPSMLTGATDSAQLRAAGIAAYGFGPGVVLGDNNGIHGNDEYLRVEPYFEYLRLMWLLTNQVAGSH